MDEAKYICKFNISLVDIFIKKEEGVTKHNIPIDKLTKKELLLFAGVILYILIVTAQCIIGTRIESSGGTISYWILYVMGVAVGVVTFRGFVDCHHLKKEYKGIIWEMYYNNFTIKMIDHLNKLDFVSMLKDDERDDNDIVSSILKDMKGSLTPDAIDLGHKLDHILDAYNYAVPHCFVYINKLSDDANEMIKKMILQCIKIARDKNDNK